MIPHRFACIGDADHQEDWINPEKKKTQNKSLSLQSSVKDGAEAFVLFLRGAQLVLSGLVSSQCLILMRWMSR